MKNVRTNQNLAQRHFWKNQPELRYHESDVVKIRFDFTECSLLWCCELPFVAPGVSYYQTMLTDYQ